MLEIEETFFLLISVAKRRIGEEQIDRIIEKPDKLGQTFFSSASFLSEKISKWILNERLIDVAFVDNRWSTPQFAFETNHEKMLEKGVNPFVSNYLEKSEFNLRNFEGIHQNLLQRFINGKITEQRTEAFYSFQDSECNEECESSCKDKMLKFKLYTGRKIFANEKKGGEAFVSFGLWHGKPAAFKVSKLERNVGSDKNTSEIFNFEKTRAEYEITSQLSHQNIVKVLHSFRYQETEIMRNRNRLLDNWAVMVMEKYEKNIGELENNERLYLPDLLQDVQGQFF